MSTIAVRISFRLLLGAVIAGAWVVSLRAVAGQPDVPISSRSPVHCPGDTRVHRTALDELAKAVGLPSRAELKVVRNAEAPPGGILLTLLDESPVCRELTKSGRINLHNQPPGADAFAVVDFKDSLVLVGATPRGLLHAVYWLADQLALGKGIPRGVGVEQTFHIPRRIFHQRFDGWPGSRADVRYISHVGATHCLVAHDWQGACRNLQGYVASPVFPDAVDPARVSGQHDALRRLIDDCADYGLEPCLWLTELPCQGGPWVPESARQAFLKRYPADVFGDSGTYEGQVLCFSHPRVQQYYRDLIKRFFAEFPEVDTVFVFGRDSGGEFCSPEKCPRCKGMSLFDQRDRFLRFLREEGEKVRPGLQVLTTGWQWDHEPAEFLAHQRRLPAGCGVYLAAEKDGWQPERQSHDFLRQVRSICRERGQLFIGYDDLHWGDDTVHGLGDIQDYPLGVAAKLRRWHQLDADGVFDHWGTWNEYIWSNSIACRAFFVDPLADPNIVCREIAVDQFGEKAGPRAFAAWQALERAHAALSNACTWCPAQWPMWYAGREIAPIPESFQKLAGGGDARPEPLKPNGAFPYNAGTAGELLQSVADAWAAAGPHYDAAIAAMRSALEIADERPVGYVHWWSGERPAPNRREHLRRQLLYLESMSVVGREMGLHFGLAALHEQKSRDAAAYRAAAGPMLRADRDACLAVAAFVERLGENPPGQITSWPALYRKKAERIEAYLNEK